MTPKERAAMQQALDTLNEMEYFVDSPEEVHTSRKNIEGAITVLREALAEPDIEEMTLTQIAARHEQAEQEPVGVVEGSGEWGIAGVLVAGVPIGTKLYTAPVRTKDLTDEEIEWLVVDTLETWNSKDTMKDFARAVIAKFKEKNK